MDTLNFGLFMKQKSLVMIVNETQLHGAKKKKTNISNTVKIREGNTEEDSVWDSLHKKFLYGRNCDVRIRENLLSMVSFVCKLSYSED